MNAVVTLTEERALCERRRRAIEYEENSQPIIREMVKIRMMFSSPWMIVKNGVVVNSGEKWTDQNAAALYRKYEEMLKLLKLIILEAP